MCHQQLWLINCDDMYLGNCKVLRSDSSPAPLWQNWRFWIPLLLPHLHTKAWDNIEKRLIPRTTFDNYRCSSKVQLISSGNRWMDHHHTTVICREIKGLFNLCLCHAVEMQVPPVRHIGQQVTVVHGVAVQMNTLGFNQQYNIWREDNLCFSLDKNESKLMLITSKNTWTTHHPAFLQKTPQENVPYSADFFHKVHRTDILPARCTLHYIYCQFLKYTKSERCIFWGLLMRP